MSEPSRWQITVDGVPREVASGGTVLEALRRLGHDVPTLCHDERLRPHPVCAVCVVEIDGRWHPTAPSCATPLHDGMVIRTRSPLLEADRRATLAMLARRMPRETLESPEEHPFARYLRERSLEGELGSDGDPALVDASHPYIRVDMSRCIHCLRCVRICDDLQGQFAWRVEERGAEVRIRPDSGTTLLRSSCVSCGACVSTCPTGALEDKTLLERGAATGSVRTTCPYCGVGCELDVRTRERHIVQVLPPLDAPVNKGHLCVKGRYAFEFVDSADRLTTPLIREPAGLRPTSWAEAIAFIARSLRAIVDRRGPDAVAVLGSARATNEENYVAQKFARVVLGTNNVDCCGRVCHAPSAYALKKMLGAGAATSSFDDIERARTMLVLGANVTEDHPVVGARIRQHALGGAGLIVVDPRRTELTRVPGALHLRVRPGTDVALLDTMACVLVEEGLIDRVFLQQRVEDWEPFERCVRRYRPEDTAGVTGVPAELVREAARRYGRERPSISFHGLGLTEHVQGSDAVMALVNLALVTGNVGVPGTGVNPLRGQNNVQGSAHMGCDPSSLTGGAPIEEAASRFERVWGAPVPRRRGLRLLSMLRAARDGELRALWAMGYDVALTDPQMAETRRSLEALELLVVQDIFPCVTAREFAHVVLPSACAFEKEGTFMNAERRVQRVRKILDPPGDARPDWDALCQLARAMGHAEGFAFETAEQIWDEIREVWPGARGMTYARLDRRGLQWPCPDEQSPGTGLLHAGSFASGRRARLRCVEYAPTPEQTSPEFPFVLGTGRSLYQFNAGTMTGRTRNVVLRPSDRLDVSPEDATKLGIVEGQRVRIQSRYGSAVLPAHLDDAVDTGQLFATFSDPATEVNALTGPYLDPHTETPEYKITAVRIERVA